jgi:glycosyltransferase involved in cell wall biosynthesis
MMDHTSSQIKDNQSLIKKCEFNENPLISIITVVFNAELTIEATIQSVLNQSYDNIQYIIIDGGSTDGTVDIIKKYQHHIKYWISETDRGIYDAMNKGWAVAHENSYILFLGAGDRIERLPNLSKYAGCVSIFGNVSLENNRIYHSTADLRIRLGNTIHHQALLLHKSIHLSPPFDLNYKAYADYDFNARLYNQGVKFIFDKSFRSYALPGGLTEKFHTEESCLIIKRNFGVFWELMAMIYYGYQNIRYGSK